jgi:MFS transporter, PHS family, inorganic phosphate transporter
MLSFVYWPTVTGPAREEVINIATLAGCIVGMILFGVLGDVYGRRKMYGIELIVLIFGTVGVLMSSNGFATGDGLSGSMDIQSWLVFFRFVSGVGLGGVSPRSRLLYHFSCLPQSPCLPTVRRKASKACRV